MQDVGGEGDRMEIAPDNGMMRWKGGGGLWLGSVGCQMVYTPQDASFDYLC